MIVFLVSPGFEYTHRDVTKTAEGIQARVHNYRDLLRLKRTPRATFVFTDLDRLSLQHLCRVAGIYRAMRDAGLTVINDPARIPTRFGLLRLLHEAGINDFNAYRVEDLTRPARWPVFLRTEGNHDRPLTDLVSDWDTLRRAVDDAIAAGTPISSLLIVEYCAEPIGNGLFRKLASFQIGNRTIAATAVHEDHWMVKYGKKGIAGPALYEDELRIVRDNPYAETISEAFRRAGIGYGRADFGIVDGRPQIYEINTNPELKFGGSHPSPFRQESGKIVRGGIFDALRAIDTPGPVTMLPLDLQAVDAALTEAQHKSRNAEASQIDVSQAATAGIESH